MEDYAFREMLKNVGNAQARVARRQRCNNQKNSGSSVSEAAL
jgi:hypothetical protein